MSYIIWNGKRSTEIDGLIICELPPITKPKMKTSITKINGRDGDIIEEQGYESYTKTISIGFARNYDIDKVMKYFTGTGDKVSASCAEWRSGLRNGTETGGIVGERRFDFKSE